MQASTVAATAVLTTADQLYLAKKLSATDAKNVLAAGDAARAGISIAVALKATCAASDTVCLSSASTRLQAAVAGLTIFQTYLAARSATP